MINLRPYQIECLDAIKSKFANGVTRQIVSLPTGAGKTVIFSQLLSSVTGPSLILAHTNELLQQAIEKIRMLHPSIEVGLVNGFRKEMDRQIVVCSIQCARQENTLCRLQTTGFTTLIIDEAHHATSESYQRVIDGLGFNGGKLMVGFTATPFRSDDSSLDDVFQELVYSKGIGDLVADGYLAYPVGVKVATNLDLRNIAKINNDYSAQGMASVMDTEEICSLMADSYIKHASGRQAIAFGCTVRHAENIAKTFRSVGISSSSIHGEMSPEEQRNIISAYNDGKITVLANCQILTEGFDAPQTSCVIVGRPTQSTGLYTQMVGRGLRKYPNKTDCVVIDFCDRNHSLCSVDSLQPSGSAQSARDKEREAKEKERRILSELPEKLNRDLRAAYLKMNLLEGSFRWLRDGDAYFLKGSSAEIHIKPFQGMYSVHFRCKNGDVRSMDGLSFEYAFSVAEDLAKENRRMFAVSDKEAEWRNSPISQKQIGYMTSKGFRAGIASLTKGQASDIIGSGALNKTSHPNAKVALTQYQRTIAL